MDTENVVYIHEEVLLSLKKGGNPAICDSMQEPGGCDAEWNKPVIEGQTLHDSTYGKSLK